MCACNKMSFVYIVVENSDEEPPGGGVFETAFQTFAEAKAAVIEKYKTFLDEEREVVGNESEMASKVDVPESKTGFTELYIEKGMFFYIHKFPVKSSGGRRRVRRLTRRMNRA